MKTLSCIRRIRAASLWALGLWLGGWGVATGDDIDPVLLGEYDTSGEALSVAVSGNYAYVAGGAAGLQVIDVSDPARPQQVGSSGPGQAMELAVLGRYAYVVDGSAGLWAVDVSDPANPQVVSAYDTGGVAVGVAASNNYVYVAVMGWHDGTNSHNPGLLVVDVSVPAHPRRMGGCDVPSASGLAVSGDYAYVARPGAGLRVIDISDPGNPRQVGACTYESAGAYSGCDIAVSGHYAYVTDAGELWYDGSGLIVIDISNPTNPRQVGRYDTNLFLWSAYAVAVSGHHAFVAASDGLVDGLCVLDISVPAQPRRVGYLAGYTGNLAVAGGRAYVATGSAGLAVIDISRLANPQTVGHWHAEVSYSWCLYYVEGLTVVGNYAYTRTRFDCMEQPSSGGVSVFDVSDPANPVRVGGTSFFDEQISDLAVSGQYAYTVSVASSSGYRLRVVNVANPATPEAVGFCNLSVAASGVAVSGQHAYVANRGAGLEVVDVSAPAAPHRVGGYDTSGEALGVAVSGTFAYVADGTNGLQVIDVSNPVNPQWVGGCDTSGSAVRVLVAGRYAFVADGPAGLQVIDISDPARPQRVGGYDTRGNAVEVAVSGGYAYVADGPGRLQVLDISDPTHPRWVASENSAFDYASGVAVSQGKVFMAAYPNYPGAFDSDLLILEMFPFFKSISREGENVRPSWHNFNPARLQRATRLTNPDWLELPGYEGTNTAALPIGAGPEFFRLVRP